MSEISVIKYQFDFSRMTRKLYEENPDLYKKALIHIRLEELQEKGAYMVKSNKPTKSGTKMTFVPVQSAEEYQKELDKIVADGEKLGLKFETVQEAGGVNESE